MKSHSFCRVQSDATECGFLPMQSSSRLVNNPISVGMEEILLFASKMYCNKKYEGTTFQKCQILFVDEKKSCCTYSNQESLSFSSVQSQLGSMRYCCNLKRYRSRYVSIVSFRREKCHIQSNEHLTQSKIQQIIHGSNLTRDRSDVIIGCK